MRCINFKDTSVCPYVMDKNKEYISPRVISNSRAINIVILDIRNQLLSYRKQCVAQTILMTISTLIEL